MESSRPKEERKTKEHITPRNRNRHEKNEQELDRTREGGPGQSGLENAGRRPMLYFRIKQLATNSARVEFRASWHSSTTHPRNFGENDEHYKN
ncbi:unnamed protein product [Schistosoma margrebowiei]|uniref:Uncharacterized protein n=1 Tax=Schistosoma margrebowiei TaxID=48269 RepID=A0A183MER0_9TREM|nr:unnamed protein product [Schistosoma margrebowiei]